MERETLPPRGRKILKTMPEHFKIISLLGSHCMLIIFYCKVVSRNRLWRVTLNLFRMLWMLSGIVKVALQIWTHRRGKRSPRSWNIALLSNHVGYLEEINLTAFEGVEKDFIKFQSSVSFLVSFWCTYVVPICIDDWISLFENHILM